MAQLRTARAKTMLRPRWKPPAISVICTVSVRHRRAGRVDGRRDGRHRLRWSLRRLRRPAAHGVSKLRSGMDKSEDCCHQVARHTAANNRLHFPGANLTVGTKGEVTGFPFLTDRPSIQPHHRIVPVPLASGPGGTHRDRPRHVRHHALRRPGPSHPEGTAFPGGEADLRHLGLVQARPRLRGR